MLRAIRFLVALIVCLVAVALPYRLRLLWFGAVAAVAHIPYRLFGKIARFVMRQTGDANPYVD